MPHPDVAARGMESWRRFGGKSIATSGEAEDKQRGERRGLWSVDRSRGALMPGSGSWGRGRGGEDVLSREAFEALLPCIFHADAVHDEVGRSKMGILRFPFLTAARSSFRWVLESR